MKSTRVALMVAAVAAIPVVAQAQIPVGTRVGTSLSSGYEDGGRRDPFVSLVAPKRPLLPASRIVDRSGSGLNTVALTDVKVTGIVKVGGEYRAIIESSDRRSYTVRVGDRLMDAMVKSVDVEGAVFADIAGPGTRAHDVRKTWRPAAEVVR